MLKLQTTKLGTIFIDSSHPSYTFLKDAGDIFVTNLGVVGQVSSEESREPVVEAPKPYTVTNKDLDIDYPDWVTETSVVGMLLRKHVSHFSKAQGTTYKKSIGTGKYARVMLEKGSMYLVTTEVAV